MRHFVQTAAIFVALLGSQGVASAEDIGDCPANAVATDDSGNAIAVDSPRAPLRAPDLGELCEDPNDPRCAPADPTPSSPSFASLGDGERFTSVDVAGLPGVRVSERGDGHPEPNAEAAGPSGVRRLLDDPPRTH